MLSRAKTAVVLVAALATACSGAPSSIAASNYSSLAAKANGELPGLSRDILLATESSGTTVTTYSTTARDAGALQDALASLYSDLAISSFPPPAQPVVDSLRLNTLLNLWFQVQEISFQATSDRQSAQANEEGSPAYSPQTWRMRLGVALSAAHRDAAKLRGLLGLTPSQYL